MKMTDMLTDGEDMGGGGGAIASSPTTSPTAPTTSPTAAPKALDQPYGAGEDSFFGGAPADTFTAPPATSFGPAAAPTPTAPMAPGIPADPFAGIAGQTGDPLAFAPYTPPSTVGAPPAAPVEPGGAQMAPDTSGFPGGDLTATAPTAFTGTPAVERYGQDYGTPPMMGVGPAQYAPDTSGFTPPSDVASPSMTTFLGGGVTPNAPTFNAPTYAAPAPTAGWTAPIDYGMPADQTQPLGNDVAQPYVPPDQRNPAVPTYQPPAFVPPDEVMSSPMPAPIANPNPIAEAPSAPISVANPTPNTPAVPPSGFNAPIDFGLPENQTTPLGAGEAQPYVPLDQRGPAVPTYQPPAFVPPDTFAAPVTPPPIERPTDTGLPFNSPTDIAPTYAPVSVENPAPPPTPFVPPVSAPTVLPNVPEATTTPAAAGPQGTPTPAASVPAATLPPQTQTQLATMTGGTTGPEQGALPPVSVNNLNAAPVSSMLTENADTLGGGGTAPITTPPIAAPVTPPLMAPTATAPAPAPTPTATAPLAPIAVSSTGLGGNAVPAFNPATVPTTGSAYAPQTTAVTPENALTGQQISVAPTADRFALAQQKLSDFVNQSNPAYQAALREATQRSAAAGGLGSGMLRTSYGNAELARENQLNTARNEFLTNALEGTIGDAYRNAQIAAQQQGFQNQQQQQAFTQALMQQELANQMQGQGFNQALQQLQAGSSGSPADMGMVLSQILGQQATGAGNAAAGIYGGVQAQQNADRQYQLMLDYLNQGRTGNTTNATTGQTVPGATTTNGTPQGIADWLSTYSQQPPFTVDDNGNVVYPQGYDAATYGDASIDPKTGRPWFETTGGTYR